MAVLARDSVTLATVVDLQNAVQYYKLQSSTLDPPITPGVHPPPVGSGWSTDEPGYTSGSTNTLYTMMSMVFSNGDYDYLPIQKSSSYEAAKQAYNAAQAASGTAGNAHTAATEARAAADAAAQAAANAAGIGQAAQESIDNLQIGGRNLIPRFTDSRWELYSQSELIDDYTLLNPGDRQQATNAQIVLPVEPNATYTLTINSDYGRTNIYEWLPDEETTGDTIFNFITGTFSRTFNTGEASHIRITLGRYSQESRDITFWNVKLEKGNKATDWTPAPEDVDASIASKADVLIQPTAPPAAMRKASTLWIDTTGGANTPMRWVSGSTWQAVTDAVAVKAAADAVAAQQNLDNLQIGGRNLLLRTHYPADDVYTTWGFGTQYSVSDGILTVTITQPFTPP